MKKTLRKLAKVGASAVWFLPAVALAQQGTTWDALRPFTTGEGPQSVGDVITTAVKIILLIAGGLAIIYLVYGGIIYITSGGNAEKSATGKNAIISSVIGIIVILIAYIALAWIRGALST